MQQLICWTEDFIPKYLFTEDLLSMILFKMPTNLEQINSEKQNKTKKATGLLLWTYLNRKIPFPSGKGGRTA